MLYYFYLCSQAKYLVANALHRNAVVAFLLMVILPCRIMSHNTCTPLISLVSRGMSFCVAQLN